MKHIAVESNINQLEIEVQSRKCNFNNLISFIQADSSSYSDTSNVARLINDVITQKLYEMSISFDQVCFGADFLQLNKTGESTQSQSRTLQAVLLEQKGSKYPALKGLATTVIVLTCFTALVYYIGYIWKNLDAEPFFTLLHLIQMVYIMIMVEVNHPANLIYFLDRLDHSKLDLNYIPEFTGTRDAIKEDLSLRPDRMHFNQIEYQWASVLINLAWYARILCTAIVIHGFLKGCSLLLRGKHKKQWYGKTIHWMKHQMRIFYLRYLIEISVFLWLGVFIEFVSTSRDSNLQQLSLVFAINVLFFLIYFIYTYWFAYITKYTKESDRSFFTAFFLTKRAIFAIALIAFAYTTTGWQLGILISIQVISTVIYGILRPERNILNYALTIINNIVFLIFLCLMFLFSGRDVSDTEEAGDGVSIFISVYLIVYSALLSILGIIRLILAFFKPSKAQSDKFSGSIVNEQEEIQAPQGSDGRLQAEKPKHLSRDEENGTGMHIKDSKSTSEKPSKVREGYSQSPLKSEDQK